MNQGDVNSPLILSFFFTHPLGSVKKLMKALKNCSATLSWSVGISATSAAYENPVPIG